MVKKNDINTAYNELLKEILGKGYHYEDPNRRGTIRREIQEYTLRHQFSEGFPVLTTKKIAWKSIVGELLWILRGDTNIKYLVDNNIPIWNKDAYNWYVRHYNKAPQNIFTYEEFVSRIKEGGDLNNFQATGITLGDVGRNYGAQLRKWFVNDDWDDDKGWQDGERIDQLSNLVKSLKDNPMGTKKTVTFWNPSELTNTALTPCHWSFEILVRPLSPLEISQTAMKENRWVKEIPEGKTLSEVQKDFKKYSFILKWHQHSVDVFLGLPFNIAFYATLAHLLGKMTNMIPEGIVGDLSNVHIYEPHLQQVKQQLSRDPNKYKLPQLEIRKPDEFFVKMGDDLNLLNDLKIEDFKLKGYESYPRIKAEMISYTL